MIGITVATRASTRIDWYYTTLLALAVTINFALWGSLGRMAAAVWAAVS